jgi:hypothetical protein
VPIQVGGKREAVRADGRGFFAPDIPCDLFDLGAEVDGARQGLIQQREQMLPDFDRNIYASGVEDLTLRMVAHSHLPSIA